MLKSSAAASVTEDGSRLAVSNLTGFDIYALKTMRSEGSYPHTVGEIYATPVLFVHGGNAVLGGSVVGQVGLWDVTTGRKHFTLRLQSMCFPPSWWTFLMVRVRHGQGACTCSKYGSPYNRTLIAKVDGSVGSL